MSKIVRVLVVSAIVTVVGLSSACNRPTKSTGTVVGELPPVVATVGDAQITREELEKAASGQLSRVKAQIYEIQKNALDKLIGDKLLAAAAKQAGKSPENYLKDEVESKIKAPTEDELKQFYKRNQAQMNGRKFEEIREQIANYLTGTQRRQLQQQLGDRLRSMIDVKINISPPRTQVSAGDAPSQGPADAKVTMIEFSDYQCPFCGRSRPTVNQVLKKYGDKIRYVFRDFPLSFHDKSAKAHEAAHCAGEQGKYWEMNHLLFANQHSLDVSNLKNYAAQIGLDQKKFDTCLDSGKFAARVQRDIQEGASYGVSGTPSFFINGIPLSGARPFSAFSKIIDEELSRSGS